MKTRVLVVVFILAVVVIAVLIVSQFFYLRKAHSTFENYYAFRGCIELLEKTDNYGTCKIANGQTIKIVKFNNKWYLDGDLPWGCLFGICFGL
jgi:hypothetical protein